MLPTCWAGPPLPAAGPDNAAVKGQHYQYAHDFANHWVDQQYLPDAIRDRQYYQFGDNKNEQAAAAYWQRIKGDKFKK